MVLICSYVSHKKMGILFWAFCLLTKTLAWRGSLTLRSALVMLPRHRLSVKVNVEGPARLQLTSVKLLGFLRVMMRLSASGIIRYQSFFL